MNPDPMKENLHPEFAARAAQFQESAKAGKVPAFVSQLLTPDDIATLESMGSEVLQRLGPILVRLLMSRFGPAAR